MDARKHIARLAALCLMMTSLFGGSASADSVTVTAERLNMRKEAGASSKAVGVVGKGDELSFVSETGDWYQVKSGSKNGYVMKEYVELNREKIAEDVAENTEPYSASARTVERVNMRELPMTGADIVKVVPKKADVEIIGRCGDWYEAEYGGKVGYLMAQYLTLQAENGESGAVPENPGSGDMIYASSKDGQTTERVNMRETPSTGADVVKVVSKKTDVSVLGENGTWYKVSAGGKEGYISKSYVRLIADAGSDEEKDEADELYAVSMPGETTARVNMRKQPSTGASVAKVLSEGQSVSVLGENGTWYKVNAGGKEGYVSKNYITLIEDGDTEAVVPEGFVSYPAARSGRTTGRVNLRGDASTDSAVLKVLNEDAQVSVLGELGGFYQILADGMTGYVSKGYIELGVSGGNASDDSSDDDASGVEGETLYSSTRTAVTTVKVNMRREPEGDVLFTLPEGTAVTLIGEAGGWYKAIYSNSTGYIARTYVSEAVSAPSAPEQDKPEQTPDVSGKGTTGYVTGASVNMRKGPSTGYGVIKVLRAGDEVTFYSETDGWYLIKAGDDTGYISAKYVSTEKPSAAPSNPGSSGSSETVNPGKVQMADWWTSDIQSIFKRGRTATVTDVDTGLSWTVYRSGGTNHADVQPYTAADTAKMKQAYKGKWSWDRHAIWVTIDGVTYAASMNGMPHGTGSITTNNFDGHHCIHFLNSRTHTGNRWDTAHQNAVQKAYKAGQK